MSRVLPLTVAVTAGLCCHVHAEQPALALGAQARPVAHIYLNAGTGERVVTLLDHGVHPGARDAHGAPVWVADNDLPCAAYGQPTSVTAILDDVGYTSSDGSTFLDWGDIPFNQVVDCVTVTWSSDFTDTDTDNNGTGDGVRGFGATWTWYDIDNGANTEDIDRVPILSMHLYDLPGDPSPTPGTLATYYATVDLTDSFSSSMAFEIGDTDSDPQGAAHHNPGVANADYDFDGQPDGDRDGDGLADFSYSMRYYQPGTRDWDGDGQPDGDPAVRGTTGWMLVAPSGPAVFDGQSWAINPVDPLPAGQGMQDRFNIYTDLDSDGQIEPVGTFWFGGFSCDADANGQAGDTRPYAQFYQVLYGPGPAAPHCPADVFPVPDGDGIINFLDVSVFLACYEDCDPLCDIYPIGQPDGVCNFFDISAFLWYANGNCPR